MTIVETIQSELAAFNEKKVALTETLRKEFPKLFAPLFDANPEVNKFSWSQYTPYFNDGESCTFSVNNGDVTVNGLSEWDQDDNDAETNVKPEVFKQFENILQSVPDEFYMELFGDHVEVIVNRDGTISTEEYEHD